MKYIAYSIYSHVDSSIKLLMMMVDMIKSIVKSIALQSKKNNKKTMQRVSLAIRTIQKYRNCLRDSRDCPDKLETSSFTQILHKKSEFLTFSDSVALTVESSEIEKGKVQSLSDASL